ncbi:MAG: 1-pyrroline-5-carboxylate dehydrogenase, partial [Sphingobacteriales bacterium]|nr:1-pyrroline-5-carboxylate dehydrogenase [Sphingobacteriales bacterium]
MSNSIYNVPLAVNEPVLNYAPGSPERSAVQQALKQMRSEVIDVPMYIGGKAVHTNKKGEMRPPHDHRHLLGH